MRAIRHAFRTLFKSPFVTTIAILSLALGIGANAAIFSMFDEILLSPLPVQEPERLVNLVAPGPKFGSTSCNQAGDCDAVFSYAMFRDLEAAETGFSGVAAHRLIGSNVAFRGETLNGEGMMVSGSYFTLLGLRPAEGRLIGPGDDETIGAHSVAVLSHDLWNTQFGSEPGVIGESIIVNGQPMTIIGVAPAGFHGTTFGARPLVYVPITMRGVMNPGFTGFDNRRSYWAYVFARLKPGVTLDQAALAVNAVYGPIINDVEAPLQQGMSDATLAQFRAREVLVEDGRRGQSSTHADARMPLLMLFATASIVLLIACANIANLLLARGANRGMEMAVRLSLGANRRQVMTQLLTESVLLGVMGGIASLFVAYWTLAGITALLPPEVAATMDAVTLRPKVIMFAAALSIGTGLLFGLFPALHSTRSDLVTSIRSNAGNLTVTRGAARFRSALVTAQIALSMTLLITAGLFLRSLTNISRVDLGLDPQNVVSFTVSPQLNGYTNEQSRQLFARIEEQLAAVPGATGVTAAMIAVLDGNNWGTDVAVEDFESGPDIDSNARFNLIGPDYFATLGVPLLNGREFTPSDDPNAPQVAIVNEAFAKKFNLGRDAVGKWMSDDGEQLNMQIVGLVADAKYSEVKDEVPPLFFTPYRQETVGSMTFYVRSGISEAEIMRSVRPIVAGLDPNLPVQDLKTLSRQVRENIFLDRMIGTLSAAFASLATLLAAVGLYGVLAYTVAQRTREIGVRMALGAGSGDVRRMVMRQVLLMLLIGGVIGIGAAVALGQAASSLLFGVEGRDPLVVAIALVVLTAFSVAAGYVPALRASRVAPVTALRYE